MIVLTRKQVNLVKSLAGVVLLFCCCGGGLASLLLASGPLGLAPRLPILARTEKTIARTRELTRVVETSVATGTTMFESPLARPGGMFESPLSTPGKMFESPLPTPATEVLTPALPPPPTVAPTPAPPPPPTVAPPATPAPPAPPTNTPAPQLVAYYITGDIVNVRSEPNATSKVIGKLGYGESVQAYTDSIGKEWYRIDFKGGNGYIAGAFASANPPPTYTPGPSKPTAPPPEVSPTVEVTPTSALPTPPPGQALVIVYSSLKEEFTFDINNQTYKVPLNSSVQIVLNPGHYGYTVGFPRYPSINGDLNLNAGDVVPLTF
jgi:uncharacterized protein YgiM (DUF1202 family)